MIVEQGIVMPDADYKLVRVGSRLHKQGRRMAIVDAADYGDLAWRNWTLRRADAGNYYAVTTIQGRSVEMHRLITGVTDPRIYVDHLDGFGLNNRRYNLVPGPPADNVATRKRWEIERNRKSGKHEVVVYSADGSRRVIAAFDTYAAAHDERYGKKAYWKLWE